MYAVIYYLRNIIVQNVCLWSVKLLFEAQMSVCEWVFGIDVDLSGGEEEPKVTDPRPISTQH